MNVQSRSGSRRARRAGLTLEQVRVQACIVLALLWGASAINYATRGPVSRNGHLKGGDYAHFYAIARLAAQRNGAELYSSDAQKRELSEALPGIEVPTYLPYLYSPQAALILVPFGWLPYFASLALWWITTTTVYLVCCRAVWVRCPHLPGSWRDFLILSLAYPGFWELFIYGHTTWIALACFTAFYLSLRSNRWIEAGVAIGLLAYKPQLGIAVFIVLVATRQWKVMAVATGTIAVHVSIAWAWFGSIAFTQYARMVGTLPEIAPLVEPQPFQLCSLRGFIIALRIPPPWSTVAYVALSSVVCAWLIAAWRRKSLGLALAVTLIATILITPHATMYDLVLLAPALILLADANLASSTSPSIWRLLYVTYFLPLTGGFVQIIVVQIASPILFLVMRAALSLERTPANGAVSNRREPATHGQLDIGG